jgi:4-diphosphocytidyl-2-C-methyl-D-erythritol kinase
MHVRSSAAGLEVLAPAKLNLFLEVLGKRGDGFHEIETLMYPIGLYDSLHFQADPSGHVRLECHAASPANGQAAEDRLPQGPDNLAWRAADLLRRRAGVSQGARLRLIKRIPLAAGLAGGSSDAAAALVAGNHVWQLGWTRQQLGQLAAEVGSDVPFFLGHGPAVCGGRGERIVPAPGLGSHWFVLARPPEGLSTAEVYRHCLPAERPRQLKPLADALARGWLARAGGLFYNALQPAAEMLSPWIGRLKQEFARWDFVGHAMTGSGTGYFGLCRHARHARRLAAHLRSRGVGRVYAVCGSC